MAFSTTSSALRPPPPSPSPSSPESAAAQPRRSPGRRLRRQRQNNLLGVDDDDDDDENDSSDVGRNQRQQQHQKLPSPRPSPSTEVCVHHNGLSPSRGGPANPNSPSSSRANSPAAQFSPLEICSGSNSGPQPTSPQKQQQEEEDSSESSQQQDSPLIRGSDELSGSSSSPRKQQRGQSSGAQGVGDGLFRIIRPVPDLTADDPGVGGGGADNEPVSSENNDYNDNERLLGTAFFTFMSFALVQLLFAFIAGSQAMMGDSAAMIVDAITYLFNWIAERKKRQFDNNHNNNNDIIIGIEMFNGNNNKGMQPVAGYDDDQEHDHDVETNNNNIDDDRIKRIRERTKRKMVLRLEIVPPIISVTTLIVVIGFVLKRAVEILYLDMHRNPSQQGIPNVNLMLAFSVFNLGLDGLNVFCFAKSNHLFGYQTDQHPHQHQYGRHGEIVCNADDENCDLNTNMNKDNNMNHNIMMNGEEDSSRLTNGDDGNNGTATRTAGLETAYEDDVDDEPKANLNMCSAYTHVFADTLRSIAVIVAAMIADLVPGVTPEEADATAAVIVSVLILLSLVPLFRGLMQSLAELQSIDAEERSENMFQNE